VLHTWIYSSAHLPADEELIKYAWPQDVWFHVDKLSSAHVYLRMQDGMEWESLPQALLIDCAQLVKANSIEGTPCQPLLIPHLIQLGNKKDNITVIYTPASNLKVRSPYIVADLQLPLCPENG
jgi:NFACT protein RNA binding domain